VSTRRRIETIGAVGGLLLLAALSLPASALAASPGPGPVGPESPAPSGVTASPAESGAPAQGFATPEEAVKAYLAGVAANDYGAVLATCAIDQMAAGYDFELAVSNYQVIGFAFMWAPATNPFYQQINQGIGEGQIAHALLFLSYSLLVTDPTISQALQNDSLSVPSDAAKAQEFMSEVDPSKLAGLSVVDVRFPKASLENNSKLLAGYATRAKIYSADEWTERVALVTLDGKDYVVGFALVRYGSDWFVAYPSSPLYGLPSTGIAVPTTQEQFDTTTSS